MSLIVVFVIVAVFPSPTLTLRQNDGAPPVVVHKAPQQPTTNCQIPGDFYTTHAISLEQCLSVCESDSLCGGFTWKHPNASGEGVTPTVNCSGKVGQPCCYQQTAAVMGIAYESPKFDCWYKPSNAVFNLTGDVSDFPHFWQRGINSPHSALTLRADWQSQMRLLKNNMNYSYTRIHAPFSRDYSVAQGPNTTSYFNAFRTYDFLVSIGMKPWIELGYTPCWMSGPAAVPLDSYWPTVDYGLCVGSPESMELWTNLISEYVGKMIERYGLEEVESWVWVLYNEPGGINAYSTEWQTGGFTYHEMFFNTSLAIKNYSKNIKVGGLSDSPDQAAILSQLIKQDPTREGLMDLFTYHGYCNGMTPSECGAHQVSTVDSLRSVLPSGMPIVLEETGSSAGPYTVFHDTIGEAAFVVQYVAAMTQANLWGAHWWCSSDIYTEHGSIPNYTWIPHQSYSGGMARAEFTGRWGFITPSNVPKPIMLAFSLLAKSGEHRIAVTNKSSAGVEAIVLASASSPVPGTNIMVFVSNLVGSVNVTLDLQTWLKATSNGNLYRIDENNNNPYGVWEKMGSPSFPTPGQTTTLLENAAISPENVSIQPVTRLLLPSSGLHVLEFKI
eukprot:m.52945 g.52945  ORF g.52945 m.52945 type:complete len:612 (+) comp10829_c0_seq2:51-1886(+)